MKKLAQLAIAASAAVISLSAFAYDDIKAPKPYSAYVQDSSGYIVRDPFGLCWHTNYWTPADAVEGCDKEIAKVAPPEPVVIPPAPPAPPAPVAKVCPKPTSEKVTFAADALFDFDKSVVKPEGKARLDDLTSKLKDMNLEVIIAVGHTDAIGSDAYNQKLSVRRADAVKAYIVSKGIEANRVYTEGKGKKQPVADNKTKEGRDKNRRVEIEVVGTRMVNPDPSCK
jgi:OmpA-OmpF porin, OOP family